jgi:hypothetical protein
MNRNNRKRKTQGLRKRQRVKHNQPPQIESNIRLTHTYRFLASSSFNGAITPTQVIGALGTMGTATNSLVTAFGESFKICRLEMWSPPASQGTASTISVDWVGSQNSPNREFSDTTVSVATPAHVVCRPPPSSLAAFWQKVSSTTIMNIVAPSGTILDLVVSLILTDDETAVSTYTVSTATVGLVYYLALDHAAAGTGVLAPVSLVTTS